MRRLRSLLVLCLVLACADRATAARVAPPGKTIPTRTASKSLPQRLVGLLKIDRAPRAKAEAETGLTRSFFPLKLPGISLAQIAKFHATIDGETFGDRMADKLAAKTGTWGFFWGFTGAIGAWMGYNAISPNAFDKPPYVGLITALSIMAVYQLPVLLMSQNRQGQKDRARFDLDLAADLHTEQQVAEMRVELSALHADVKRLTELLEAQHKSAPLPPAE